MVCDSISCAARCLLRREEALDFLTTGFPEHEAALLRDILGACGGDANAATTRLLEMRDEEEAHRVAQQMQELSAAPVQVRIHCLVSFSGSGSRFAMSCSRCRS